VVRPYPEDYEYDEDDIQFADPGGHLGAPRSGQGQPTLAHLGRGLPYPSEMAHTMYYVR